MQAPVIPTTNPGNGGEAQDNDPRPVPPEPPLASDCCDSGCPMCVYDIHAEEMQHYREQLAAWLQRHPEASA